MFYKNYCVFCKSVKSTNRAHITWDTSGPIITRTDYLH